MSEEELVEYSSFVRVPSNDGLTGIAISTGRVFILQPSEKNDQFSVDTDNCVEANSVKSMVIGPMINPKGECKGVIQLINKLDGKDILKKDIIEFAHLLPPMAQLISNMDDLIRILALQSSIKEYLAGAYKGMNE